MVGRRRSAKKLLISHLMNAFAVLGLSLAYATSFVERPFPDLVQDSPSIARGRIGMAYTGWAQGKDGSKRIYTYTELQITEAVKGEFGGSRTLMMRELGGEKDGVGMEVSGAAKFSKGEDVVVFLSGPNPDGTYDVRNMMMGKYNLVPGNDGKEYLIGPGIDHRGGHGDDHETAPSTSSSWTLDRLRTLVQTQAQAQEPSPSTTPSPAAQAPPLNQTDAAPQNTPEKATGLSASQLQPEAHGESPTPWAKRLTWGGISAFLLILVFVLRARAKQD